MLGEDECDRGEHRALADAVGRRVEERAERRRLAADAGERAVEDVEQRADDEDPGREPVDEPRVPVLERDEDGGRETERDAGVVRTFGVTRVRARPVTERLARERDPVV